MNQTCDIAIIGGGPAGSTAATLLAKKGYKTILLEKEKFPRHHVGESLLPFCHDIFEKLGVLDEMKKRFLRKPGAVFCDAEGRMETTYCFKNVISKPKHLSFHVRRDEFDNMLLKNSIKYGTSVYQEATVFSVNIEKEDPIIDYKTKTGISQKLKAKFVLDASGREGVLARINKWRVPSKDLDRIAFHSYWDFDKVPQEIKLGMIRIVYLGGKKKGWIWCIPVNSKRISIGLVVDNKSIANYKKEDNTSSWAKNLYHSELKNSSCVNNILSEAKCDDKIWINGDYSYTSKQKFGANFAMIGDSGQFIDPIFSSGVFIAMKSAKLVSSVLPKYLEDKQIGRLEKVFETISNGYETVEELIKLYYNPDQLNFSSMGGLNVKSRESFTDFKQSYALLHYLLAGDFFERGHIYKEFFKELKSEKKFNRWKNLVKWDSEKSGVYHKKGENCGEHLIHND